MHKYYVISLLFFAFLLSSSKAESSFKIIVDPGHGGSDSGAVRGKYREADIALSVSKKLVELLKKSKDFHVIQTRTDDSALPIGKRTQFARQTDAQLFVSIHLNSSYEEKVRGTEFYFQNQLAPEEESLLLANIENQTETNAVIHEDRPVSGTVHAVLEDLDRNYQIKVGHELAKSLMHNWGNKIGRSKARVKQGPFQVLLNTKMPAVLIELGFISNPKEAEWLTNEDNQRLMAKTIFESIEVIKEKMDRGLTKRDITSHAN